MCWLPAWGVVGGQPPNGSGLSCGRLARRPKCSGRRPCPPGAQHSTSFRAITARQLQALVRRLGLDKRSSRRSRSKHARIGHRPKPNHLNRCLTVRDVLIDEEVLLTRLSVDCVDLQKSAAADLGRRYVASPRHTGEQYLDRK